MSAYRNHDGTPNGRLLMAMRYGTAKGVLGQIADMPADEIKSYVAEWLAVINLDDEAFIAHSEALDKRIAELSASFLDAAVSP